MPCCTGIHLNRCPGLQTIASNVTASCTFVKEGIKESNLWFTARQIYSYVKAHLGKIIKFLIAWGLIVSFVGLLYGFSATALPLAIGLGGGTAFGTAGAVMSHEVLKNTKWNLKKYEEINKNTIYGHISWSLYEQDEGTKAILITVTVTVIFAAMAAFPQEVGIFLGVIVGNHIWIKMILYDRRKKLPEYPTMTRLDSQMTEMQRQIGALTARLDRLDTHDRKTN